MEAWWGERYLGAVVGVSRKGERSRESTFGEDARDMCDGMDRKGRVCLRENIRKMKEG